MAREPNVLELEKLMKSSQQPGECLIKGKKTARILIIEPCSVLTYPDSAVALKTTTFVPGIVSSI